ncbi:hypothetical protein [Candidatus Anaplasma sp. TIGMIC]|uniref:hypothetical protein n=1 Tax=Candidatus Anaplasma sp. TIGMIC TaxID=3020713 RepID=UPI0023306817|nr:hypothetical protein [Candidatus Anaplasma sp. TIGMIC]MDB1135758.1 hypothetical protein [Candidatus Anaplasma sp. TIGMIC]
MHTSTRKGKNSEVTTERRRNLVYVRPKSRKVLIAVICITVLFCAAVATLICLHYASVINISAVFTEAVIAPIVFGASAICDLVLLCLLIAEKTRKKRVSNFVEETNESGKYYMAIMTEPHVKANEISEKGSGSDAMVFRDAIARSGGKESKIEFLLESGRYMCKVGDMIYSVRGIEYFTKNEEKAFRKYVRKSKLQDNERRFVLECAVPSTMYACTSKPPRSLPHRCAPEYTEKEMKIKGAVRAYFKVDANNRDALLSLVVGKYDRSLGVVNDFYAATSYIEYHERVTGVDFQRSGSTEEMRFRAMCESGIAADLIQYREEFAALLPRLRYIHRRTLGIFIAIAKRRKISDVPQEQRNGTSNGILRAICATTSSSSKVITSQPSNNIKAKLILNFIADINFCQGMIYYTLASILECDKQGVRFRASPGELYSLPLICTHIPELYDTAKSFAGVMIVNDKGVISGINPTSVSIKNLAMVRGFGDAFAEEQALINYAAETLESRRRLLDKFGGDRLKAAIVIAEASIKNKEVEEMTKDMGAMQALFTASEAALTHRMEMILMRLLGEEKKEDREIMKDLVSFFSAMTMDFVLDDRRDERNFNVDLYSTFAAMHNAYALFCKPGFADGMGLLLNDEVLIGQYFPFGGIEHVKVVHDSMGVLGSAADISKSDTKKEKTHMLYDECETIPKAIDTEERDVLPPFFKEIFLSGLNESLSSKAGTSPEATSCQGTDSAARADSSASAPVTTNEVVFEIKDTHVESGGKTTTQVEKCEPEPHQSYVALKLTGLYDGGDVDFSELKNVTVRDIKFHDLVCDSDTSKKFKSCKISGFDQVFSVAPDSFQVKSREEITEQIENYSMKENELHVVLNLNADRTPVLARMTKVDSSEEYELPDQLSYSLSGSTHVLGLSQLGFDTTSHKGLLGAMLSSEARKRIPYLTGALKLYVEYHSHAFPIESYAVLSVVEPPAAQIMKDIVMYNREFRNVAESNVLPRAQSESLLSIINDYYCRAGFYVVAMKVLEKGKGDISPDFLSSLIVASWRTQARPPTDGKALPLRDDIVCADTEAVQNNCHDKTTLMLLVDRDYRSFHMHQILEKVCEEVRAHGTGFDDISAKFDRFSIGLPGVLEVAYILANSSYGDEQQASDATPFGKFRVGFNNSTMTITGFDGNSGREEGYTDILVGNPGLIKAKVNSLMKDAPEFMLPWAYIQVLLDVEPDAKQKFQSIFEARNVRLYDRVVFNGTFKERKEYLASLARSNDGQLIIKKAVAFMISEDLCALFKGKENRCEIFETYKRSDGIEHFVKYYKRTHPQISTKYICKDYIPIGSALELPKVEMVAMRSRDSGELQIPDVTQNSTLTEMSGSTEHVQHAHAL